MSVSCFPFSLLQRRSSSCADNASTLVDSAEAAHDKKWPANELGPFTNGATSADLATFTHSTTSADAATRLARFREKLADAKLDAYIILSADAHGSEYLAPSDQRRDWLSGFTGSAGVAIVTANEAHLFTDSRYWVQAARQISDDWTLHRVGEPEVLNWNQWLLSLPKHAVVGVDGRTIPSNVAASLNRELEAANLKLVVPDENLVDLVWENRPARPCSTIYIQPLEYTGRDATDKLDSFRAWIISQAEGTATGALLSNLSEIAWLVNLRGSDIRDNPMFFSYLYVSADGKPGSTVLFTGPGNVDDTVREYLETRGVSIQDYDRVLEFVGEKNQQPETRKYLLSNTIPFAVTHLLPQEQYAFTANWVAEERAIKNDVELAGFKKAYLRDGIAYARWFAWLDEQIRVKCADVDEWQAAEKLEEYRLKLPLYKGPAYESISGSGPNGALPHYTPSPVASRIIDRETPYVIDAGGQWLDGTCDTTRTYHFGRPTTEHREAFTRVLQGHIAIDKTVFPTGTDGRQLDTLARSNLWQAGLDYGHGTGHGFGEFLSVHEGPQGIGAGNIYPIKAGHVLTNEPGYYKEGHFGIRIESALKVVSVSPPASKPGSKWLSMERFTRVPIQAKLVDAKLLTPQEIEWLKKHNDLVYEDVLPHIKDDARAVKWLRRERDATQALARRHRGACGHIGWPW